MTVLRRAAATIVAAALTLIAAPPAFSAAGVYGGTTTAREAIVLTTDAAGKKLRSAVVSWEAACTDGMTFPFAMRLTAVKGEPGFMPKTQDLLMSRNARGRFAGTQLAGLSLGDHAAAVVADLSGRLRTGSATGKLSADVSIIDGATGDEVTHCSTGSLSWSATRSAGRVFGGNTSQGEPIVIRLDRKRKTVTDVLTGWASSTCEPPDRYFRFPFGFSRLRVRNGRFGVSYEEPVSLDDGGSLKFTYDVSGSLTGRSARGGLRVTVAGTDPAGTANLGCDSGEVSWRAATG